MAETPSNVPALQPAHAAEQNEHKAGWLAAGGILAAIAAYRDRLDRLPIGGYLIGR